MQNAFKNYHKRDQVKILIVLRKPCCNLDKIVQAIGNCGKYTHCELYCPEMLYNGKVGWTFTNFSFYNMQATQNSLKQYRNQSHLFDVHEIFITSTEHIKLLRWNLDLIYHNCSYNYSDLMLHLLPNFVASAMRPDNKDKLFAPTKLYCAQAVILALQHALGPEHKISRSLAEINIHLCKPSSINQQLSLILGAPKNMNQFVVL